MTHQTNNPDFYKNTSEQEGSKLPTLDSVVGELMHDESINILPKEEQGKVIVDRFVGALVRQGQIEGKSASYNPADILNLIDGISRTPDAVMTITRTNGLRQAVTQLMGDERTGSIFGRFSEQLKSSFDAQGNESFTLTTPAQIEGYILSGGDKNYNANPVGGVDMRGNDWIPVLLEQTQRMVDDPHVPWMTTRDARELIGSSAPLIKNTGRDWLQAESSAKKAGVDMELVRRSAEAIQQQREYERKELGARALFVATNGQIAQYKEDLNRRSSF